MHPIERLRYVARVGDADDMLLAAEAAEALAGLAFDPRALVVAARRLLEFHPDCAPLWWVAARVLAAQDARLEARECVAELEVDAAGEELAAALPGAATAAAASGSLVVDALDLRPDLCVRLVAEPFQLSRDVRRLSGVRELAVFTPEDVDAAIEGATLAVVEIAAASDESVLLGAGARELAAAARAAGVALWGLAPMGHVLPGPLFRALLHRTGDPEVLDASGFATIVSDAGAERPCDALSHPGCVALGELAR